MVKLKIYRGTKTQFVVSNQVVTNPCYGLAVVFCGFISLLTGRETINILLIFSGVHSFTGMTVTNFCVNRFSNVAFYHYILTVHYASSIANLNPLIKFWLNIWSSMFSPDN